MGQKELVLQAKNGDAAAFSSLYGLYKKKLYSYAFFKLGNQEDAEDAVSDCVLTAFEEIHKLKSADAFHSWIFRILYCSCSAKIKEQIAQRNTGDIDNCINISAADCDRFIEQEELRQALAVLRDEDKNIVLLSVVAGLKSKEIAKITGFTAGNVRQRLRRSLIIMKEKLV